MASMQGLVSCKPYFKRLSIKQICIESCHPDGICTVRIPKHFDSGYILPHINAFAINILCRAISDGISFIDSSGSVVVKYTCFGSKNSKQDSGRIINGGINRCRIDQKPGIH